MTSSLFSFLNLKTTDTLLNNFNQCIKNVYSDGMLGKYNDEDNLFKSPDKFKQYFQCFVSKLPEKSSLSDDEQQQFQVYKKCMLKVGHKCLGDKN
ncbi:UNVERIFIED_CONTAM: hypothetical protein NCL1_30805 [Trichonephila clavipes]